VYDDDVMAGVFSMLDDDAAIWESRECGAHCYLHRISRAPRWEGRGLVDAILTWAHAEARRRGKLGLRMDTWASNHALIDYYGARGFALVGTRLMPADSRLSPHYHGIELALLEAPSV
jgi:ribosomal protein S18 acetylase RimI-like enzyme